ncbi:4-coumarate--CoA ligase 1-like [Ixodes scapularis]
MLQEGLMKWSTRTIAVDSHQSLTAIELLTKIQRYAVGFQEHGLEPGSRVCAYIRNSIENLAALQAVLFAGATLVMAKTSYVAREVLYTLRDGECDYILTDKETAPNLREITMPPTIKRLFSVGSAPGFIDVLEFQELSETDLKPHVPADNTDEVVVMLYTSGTTGLPKAVELSHRAYVSCYRALQASGLFTEDDVTLAWNPLTHVSGFMLGVVNMCLGAKIVITEPSISCKDLLETLAKHQVSVTLGFPDRLRELVNEAKMNNYPAVSLKKIAVAGTAISDSLRTEICKFFNVKSLVNFYGMTETNGFVSCTPVGQISMGSVGIPCAGTKAKIIDLVSGDPLGPNEKGELVVQSGNLMKGYYGHPEDTREVLGTDGWFRTGDIGYYDDDGHIYIIDRLKQMIKCMGNVVTPAELEDILTSHEAVVEAAVVGIPSSKYGEAPTACVVVSESKEWHLESLERELKRARSR